MRTNEEQRGSKPAIANPLKFRRESIKITYKTYKISLNYVAEVRKGWDMNVSV